MNLPDDVAHVILSAAQADGRIIEYSVVDEDEDNAYRFSYCLEVVKTRTFRALTCVSSQMKRLARPILMELGRVAYRTSSIHTRFAGSPNVEHIVFIELRN